MKQILNYYLIKSFMGLGKILPKKMLYGLNHWLLLQFYQRKRVRRELTLSNLRKGFPEETEEYREKLSLDVYSELSRTITEVQLLNADRLDIEAAVANAEETLERLKALEQNAPNGIVYIMAHYGNWELLGHWMALHGHTLTGVVKEGKNREIDEKILLPFRSKYGNVSVPHKGSMLTLAKALKAGKSISLAIDQVVQPPNGVVVNFFGHQTAATKAIAALKQKYDPLVVPIFMTRLGDEVFEVELYDPIEIVCNSILSNEEKMIHMTQCYYDVIESQIKKSPEQWLWLYNRWKGIKFENA